MQWKRQREGPRLYPRHRPPLPPSLLVRTDVLLSHRLQLGNLYNNRPARFSSHHCFEGVLEFKGIFRGWRKFARRCAIVRIFRTEKMIIMY